MASVLKVLIHSENSEFPTEKRYDPNIKVADLKKRLELITGANHSTMKLTAFIEDEQIGDLEDNNKSLADYLGEKLNELPSLKFVVKDDHAKEILDGDLPKYEISEEKYKERQDTARNFIKEIREKQEKN